MDNDRFTEAIGDIERGLRHEDPDFVQRIRHLQRRDDLTALSVFALLTVGAGVERWRDRTKGPLSLVGRGPACVNRRGRRGRHFGPPMEGGCHGIDAPGALRLPRVVPV
jgi:hypothetical protein